MSARAAVGAATRVAELGDWIAGEKAERELGEIMPPVYGQEVKTG